jgi:DNA-binding HxlR family transcriptional regulator
METKEPPGTGLDRCDTLGESEKRLTREILGHIADKWSVWVIHALGTSGRLRFSRLLEQVEGVSQKMLTKTLRKLERDGLVTRTMYPEVPPRVEYELSATGRQLLVHTRLLWTWVIENVEGFKAARKRSDGARATKRGARP